MSDLSDRIARLSEAKRQLLEQRLQARAPGRLPPIPRLSGDASAPLSYAQRSMWFLQQLHPDSGGLNRSTVVRLRGPLDLNALERALETLVDRQDILRTVYPTPSWEPVQVVLDAGTHRLEFIDLSSLSPPERQIELDKQLRRRIEQPFDLRREPPFRPLVFRLAEEEHVLAWALHHIASDRWSAGVLYRELGELYGAFREGRAPTLDPLPVRYRDVAAWERARLAGQTLEGQLAYWKDRLAGAPPLLQLPLDRPRSADAPPEGGFAAASIPASFAAEIRALSRQHGATPFMTFLAAYNLLLRRYTGQEDILVGVPVAGRRRPEVEGLVGLFVNTLVLRSDLSGSLSFLDLLAQVRAASLAAADNEDLPFERLVEALDPDRGLTHTPLFQVLFDYLNTPGEELSIAGLTVERVRLPRQASQFDLSLEIIPEGEGYRAGIEYDRRLFDPTSIERMLDRYLTLLAAAIRKPETALLAIPLEDPDSAPHRPQHWAGAIRDWPANRSLAAWIAGRAAERADAVAVRATDEEVTYRELEIRSARIARGLRRAGAGPGARVGICMERSVDQIAAVIGVLKCGAAYLPIDPANPPARIRTILEDCSPAAVLVSPGNGDLFPAGAPVQTIAEIQAGEDDESEFASPPFDPAAPAYIMYTSGTTGGPKGVRVRGDGLLNFVHFAAEFYDFRPEDRVLQFAALSFDTSVEEIFPALLRGARLVLRPPDLFPDFEAFHEFIEREAISVLDLPTAYWHAWVADLERRPRPLPGAVRLVIVGGEEARPASLLAWRSLVGTKVRWVNTYGPTEATVVATVWEPGESWGERGAEWLPIGRPIANVRAYVLDEHFAPVPPGIPGELYLGGAGIADGYQNRPEQTAARFLRDPFAESGDGLLFRTGDRVRQLTDGSLLYLGRMDRQVKLRGMRVEPGEIEGALLAHPDVAECAVLDWPAEDGTIRLAGYLVSAREHPPAIAEVRSELAGRLPGYMVPAYLGFVEAIPYNTSGKVDRAALPRPAALEAAGADEQDTAPRTGVERVVAGVWSVVLGISRVGVHTNFFEVGGHSLLAIQAVGRIEEALRIRLSLRDFLEAPTAAAVASRLESLEPAPGWLKRAAEIRLRLGDPAEDLSPAGQAALQALLEEAGLQVSGRTIPRRGGSDPAPLSFAQERVWFLDQLEGPRGDYNISIAFRLRGPLPESALSRSFDAVVRRHEILRSRFPRQGDRPVQVVAEAAHLPLEIVNLEGHPRDDREAEAARQAAAFAGTPFNLEKDLPLRARLWRLGQDDHALALAVHHIAADEWSIDVLLRELSACCAAYFAAAEPGLPELPIQYGDYAAWQRDAAGMDALASHLGFWLDALHDPPPPLLLPADRPRPVAGLPEGGTLRLYPVPELLPALQRLARAEQTTLFTVLQAGFAALLHRHSGQEDFLLGTPVTVREGAQTENLVGFFLNTLVLRCRFDGAPSFRETVRRSRAAALEAFERRHVPFEKLVEALRPLREDSRSPLFNTLFVYRPAGEIGLRLPGVRVERFKIDPRTAMFDLTLFAEIADDALRLTFNYSADLFEQETIRRMLRRLETLLVSAAADPDQPVTELPILPDDEAEHIASLNQTREDIPAAQGVHALFEAQAARTPDAPALSSGGHTVTYAALNARANRLAHALHGMGVGRDVLVGLYLERSIEAVVSLLGVLKAGGAYLPLDPTDPPARTAQLLDESRAALVLTHRGLASRLPQDGPRVVGLDGAAFTEGLPASNPDFESDPDRLVYAIFTSGSTGTPKGVAMGHRALANLVAWHRAHPILSQPRRTLQRTPLGFDVSFQEIAVTLSTGGTLVMAPEDARTDFLHLLDTIREERIERIFLPFVGLQALAEVSGSLGSAGLPLREVVTAGEQLRITPAIRRFFEALPSCTLHNHYGPTECHLVTEYVLPGKPEDWPLLPPIGRPIANARVHLLDNRLQPVPIGIPGELYVGGASQARGYLNRPGLTDEVFIPDPVRPADPNTPPSERVYRTGDLARMRPDGELEFLGRRDRQVKIRGHRVEPAEVEAVLDRHPAVVSAVVVAREETHGDLSLAAYLVCNPEAGVDADSLRRYARERLPGSMVPRYFVMLDSFPLTSSGKVDRLALPAPRRTSTGADSSAVPVLGDLERRIASVWEAVLDVRPVGADDDFFALGGHSLLAIRLFARLEEALGERLPLALLYEAPTVRRLAIAVERRADSAGWSPLVAIQAGGRRPPLFLVHGFGGGVVGYAGLAARLGPDQPVYGLQARGLDGRAAPDTDIETMARRYILAMRSVQPEGPYALGGYCLGGVVAYEIARQLHVEGETVAHIAILEGYAPLRKGRFGGLRRPREFANFLRNLPYWLRDYLGQGWRALGTAGLRRLQRQFRKMRGVRGPTPESVIGRDAALVPEHIRRLMEVQIQAQVRYRPGGYQGRVDLFRVQRLSLLRAGDPLMGWGNLAAKVKMHMVPGRHDNILEEPHVKALADALGSVLPARDQD